MKHVLVREIVQLCERNKDGSFSTQAARKDILIQAGKQLLEIGRFRNMGVTGLKPKHVQFLVNQWQKVDRLSDATIKNRIAHLRWWADKINKQNVIPKTNAELGVSRRKYVTNQNKAIRISDEILKNIKDERLRCSIELQRAFGLRREEALKFQPSYALAGGYPGIVRLKASWCKGGRAREIPILNDYQKAVLARAAMLAGAGSMIPAGQRYVERLKQYENTTNFLGLSRLHGLRHAYAQDRYKELTSWECPARGGPTNKQLDPEQKEADRSARLTISNELGHNRENITAVYLGR